MSFAAPWVLVGLLAAAVPILLHLVHRREPPEQAFPAVQYLEDATREHRRRLRLREWLLLALRTALVVLVVAAAAGPLARRAVPLGRHAASALVLVVDNSASSAAIRDGEPLLDALRRTAGEVLRRATPADRLWLVLADGIPRPGTAAELQSRLDALESTPVRLDLADAIRQGHELIRGSGRAGEVVVVSDAQRSAVNPVSGEAAVVVLRPAGDAPLNRALGALDPGPQPWGAEGGRVRIVVAANDTQAVPVSLQLEGRPARDLLAVPGLASVERLAAPPSGWRVLRATLPPDELRLDDAGATALRVAPPARVSWSPGDTFLDVAFGVLVDAGRVTRGSDVRIGELGPAASIVVPPGDPALISAANRGLAARGVAWRFGTRQPGPATTDSGALLPERIRVAQRVSLEAIGAGADTLATAAGEPWIVRSGDVVLVGSRFDPAWTELPVRAAFVPLLDALVTRAVRGEPALPVAAVGDPLTLPARVTAVAHEAQVVPAEGGAPWRPGAPGVHWLLEGADTVGAVTATIDARESALPRATDAELREAWPGAVVASLDGGADRTFALGGRGDLRPLLLVLALGCLVGESLLAGRRGKAG